jgi:hypothetical protein
MGERAGARGRSMGAGVGGGEESAVCPQPEMTTRLCLYHIGSRGSFLKIRLSSLLCSTTALQCLSWRRSSTHEASISRTSGRLYS